MWLQLGPHKYLQGYLQSARYLIKTQISLVSFDESQQGGERKRLGIRYNMKTNRPLSYSFGFIIVIKKVNDKQLCVMYKSIENHLKSEFRAGNALNLCSCCILFSLSENE